jgi:hypothetical protein
VVTLFTPHISSYDTLINDNRIVKLTSISSEGSELLVAVSSCWLEATLRALVEDSMMHKSNIRQKKKEQQHLEMALMLVSVMYLGNRKDPYRSVIAHVVGQ